MRPVLGQPASAEHQGGVEREKLEALPVMLLAELEPRVVAHIAARTTARATAVLSNATTSPSREDLAIDLAHTD